MAETGVRIRLAFQDAGILTKQQVDQGLAQCWHLVRFDEVRTIAEVASDISSVFNLGGSCPAGLGLEVDGFVLPPSQSAHLLKDSDLVRIKRRKDQAIIPVADVPRGVRNDQHYLINGCRYASYGGLELRAIDEFEKETGGYESEEEEGEMETDISLDAGGSALGGPKVPPLFLKEVERSSKKRKRAKDAGTDLGKKKRNSSNGLALAVWNLEAKQEKSKANRVSRRAGVNVRALDEFEGERGGYESEEEEDENENEEETDISLGGTKTILPFEVRSSGTPKEEKRRAKKQQGSKKGRDILDNDQMQQLNTAVNDDVEEEPKEASKKKKKKSSEMNITKPAEEITEPGPEKSKEKKSSRRAGKEDALQNMDENKDAQQEGSRKKRSKEKGNNDLASVPTVGDDSWMDLEDTLMSSGHDEDKQRMEDVAAKGGATSFSTPDKDSKKISAEEEHRPSRSARRKKAKRKWLREQQAKTANVSAEGDVSKGLPSNEDVAEVETVEELQPVVVRAGHIRFERSDEDDCGDPPPSSLPVINLGEKFKSKRQGQNWGQEKYAEKQKIKRRSTESGNEEWPEVNVHSNGKSENGGRTHQVDLEKLPLLQGAPQEGDVIAYRLVELTSSWTPELSPYRVGVVASVDEKIDGISLAPHPDYPIREMTDADLDGGAGQESEAYPFPYDDRGFLETNLPSLVDLRLLERKLGPNRGQEDDEVGEQNEKGKSSAKPEGVASSVPPVPESGDIEIPGPDNAKVENETQFVAEGSGQNAAQQLKSTKASDNKAGEAEKDVSSSPDWQTVLTQELQRKKLEIRQKNADSGDKRTNGEPEKAASVSRKSKYLRSAGVGSIVALLRAQQAL